MRRGLHLIGASGSLDPQASLACGSLDFLTMPRTNTLPILFVLRVASLWALCGVVLVEPRFALAQDREEEKGLSTDAEESDKQDSEDEESEESESEGEDEDEGEDEGSNEEDSEENSDESSKGKSNKKLPELIPEPENSDAPPLPDPEEGHVKSCQMSDQRPLSSVLSLSTLLLLLPLRSKTRA